MVGHVLAMLTAHLLDKITNCRALGHLCLNMSDANIFPQDTKKANFYLDSHVIVMNPCLVKYDYWRELIRRHLYDDVTAPENIDGGSKGYDYDTKVDADAEPV